MADQKADHWVVHWAGQLVDQKAGEKALLTADQRAE